MRDELPSRDRLRLVEEVAGFLQRRSMKGRLHLAGGEPFLCPDLLPVVEAAAARGIPSRILSNGTCVDAAVAEGLRRAGCVGVQVSVEGPEGVHDALRGAGAFRAATLGVETLRRAGLFVTLAMTLHERNVAFMEDLGRLAADRANRVYYSRLVPCGRGAELGGALDMDAWWRAMRQAISIGRRLHIPVALRDPTFRPFFVSPRRARQWKMLGGCAAGHATLTVEADGSVMPCRRLGVTIGHALEDGLDHLWDTNETLASLRDRDALKGRCGRCDYRRTCGGCRAVAIAISGDLLAEDPQCPWSRLAPRLMAAAGRVRSR